MKIVLDTNILIAGLIKNGIIRDSIIQSKFEFITPAYTLSEIEKHRTEICKKANITAEQFSRLLQYLLNYIQIINPLIYSEQMQEAKDILGNIDINDVPFLACAIAFDAYIWSDDKDFKRQNRIKILTTEDMIGTD